MFWQQYLCDSYFMIIISAFGIINYFFNQNNGELFYQNLFNFIRLNFNLFEMSCLRINIQLVTNLSKQYSESVCNFINRHLDSGSNNNWNCFSKLKLLHTWKIRIFLCVHNSLTYFNYIFLYSPNSMAIYWIRNSITILFMAILILIQIQYWHTSILFVYTFLIGLFQNVCINFYTYQSVRD